MGLSDTFLARRLRHVQCPGQMCRRWKRDLGVSQTFEGVEVTNSTIQGRFDHATNGKRLGRETLEYYNKLSVTTAEYATLDDALLTTAVTTTKSILNSKFTSSWSASARSAHPLVLAARSFPRVQHGRTRISSTTLTWSGSLLNINFCSVRRLSAPAPGDGWNQSGAVPIQPATGWSSYPSRITGPNWPAGGEQLANDPELTDARRRAGMQFLMQMLYAALHQGFPKYSSRQARSMWQDWQTGDRPIASHSLESQAAAIKFIVNSIFCLALAAQGRAS